MYQNPQPDPSWVLSAYEDVVDTRYDDEREGRVHTFGRELDYVDIGEVITPTNVVPIVIKSLLFTGGAHR